MKKACDELVAMQFHRGLVVVGSPNTLSSDASWRGWIRWVRDHGAFATANALPLCPWESPDDDSSAAIDTSELAPQRQEGDLEVPASHLNLKHRSDSERFSSCLVVLRLDAVYHALNIVGV